MLVSIVTKLRTRLSGFRIPAEARVFCPSLQSQTEFTGPPSLLSSVYQELSRELSFQGVRLSTCLLSVPRLRTSGFITPLPFYTCMAHLGTHFAFMSPYKNYRL
jgi:hypothetical protein